MYADTWVDAWKVDPALVHQKGGAIAMGRLGRSCPNANPREVTAGGLGQLLRAAWSGQLPTA
ncbi:hypothetical protein [Streptomyces sp. NPDC001536]|uniref:hypothetical protein n=1 Tax=Streptomyces sp. NPDC001536 TaxID=3364583 RepID=UPI0036A3DC7A